MTTLILTGSFRLFFQNLVELNTQRSIQNGLVK